LGGAVLRVLPSIRQLSCAKLPGEDDDALTDAEQFVAACDSANCLDAAMAGCERYSGFPRLPTTRPAAVKIF